MVARTPRGVEEFATPFRRNLPQRLALELSLKFVRVHFDWPWSRERSVGSFDFFVEGTQSVAQFV